MGNLSFDTGKKEYDVNGGGKIYFNPTDIAFIDRLNEFITEEDKREYEQVTDPTMVFEVMRQRNADIRSRINAVFQEDVCASVFGDMNLFTVCNGLPVYMNFLLAVIDEVDDATGKEQAKTSERVEFYKKKYAKYML